MTAPATVMELDDLLDALANHYEGFDGSTSIDKATQGDLRDIFDQLVNFYALGDGMNFSCSDELWIIYDSLVEIYSERFAFEMSDD